MRIVLDEHTLEEEGYSLESILAYLFLERGLVLSHELQWLEEQGLVSKVGKGKNSGYKITKPGSTVIGDLLKRMGSEYSHNVESSSRFLEHVDDTAEKLRGIFPKGKQPNTGKPWSESCAIISSRLKQLNKKYGVEYTQEEILDAAERYVKDNIDNKYMRTLRYFIFKDDKRSGEETSDLMTYIENKGEESNNSYSTGEWTSELR